MTNSILCAWGANSHGQLGTGDQEDRHEPTLISNEYVDLVSGGGGHSVLSKDSQVYTCGLNTHGELGRTDDPFHFLPIPFKFDTSVISLACGWDFTLVLTRNGTVYAWGSNRYGQLGIGERIKCSTTPHPLSLPPVRSIAAGLRHSLAVTTEGEVYAWGSNRRGQLGLMFTKLEQGSTKLMYFPTLINPSWWDKIREQKPFSCSAGAYHSALLTSDGSLTIWGDLSYLQPSKTTIAGDQCDRPGYLRIPPIFFNNAGLVQVVSGWDHLTALTDVGTVFTWGRSHLGQLARDQPNHQSHSCSDAIMKHDPTPKQVQFSTTDSQLVRIARLAAGSAHTLAVGTDGHLYAWGWNEHGMCGLSEADGAVTSSHANQSFLWSIDHPRRIILPVDIKPELSERLPSIGAGCGHSFAFYQTEQCSG